MILFSPEARINYMILFKIFKKFSSELTLIQYFLYMNLGALHGYVSIVLYSKVVNSKIMKDQEKRHTKIQRNKKNKKERKQNYNNYHFLTLLFGFARRKAFITMTKQFANYVWYKFNTVLNFNTRRVAIRVNHGFLYEYVLG
jgi:hypothetical protein